MAKVLTSKDMALPDKEPEAKKAQEKPATKPRGRTVFQVRCEHVPQEGRSNIAFPGPDGKAVQLELKDGAFKFPSKMPLNAAKDLLRFLVAAGLKDESRFVPEGKGKAREAPEKEKKEDEAKEPEPGTEELPILLELVHPDNTQANPIEGKFVIKVDKKKVVLDVVDGRVETESQEVADALIEKGFRPTWGPEGKEEKK